MHIHIYSPKADPAALPRWHALLFAVILVPLLLPAWPTVTRAATTRYVTDNLEITLRSGQSTKHQILRMLKSGTKLDILETNPKSGYSRVRTAQGLEGWVLTRYLVNVAGARERLAESDKKIVKLEIANTRLQGKLGRLSEDYKKANAERQKLKEDTRRLNQELNTGKPQAIPWLSTARTGP